MSTGTSYADFEKELNRLVESFGNRLAELKILPTSKPSFATTFLIPSFARSLGHGNRAGLIQKHREVEIESRTGSGRADYLFRPERKQRLSASQKARRGTSRRIRHAIQALRLDHWCPARVALGFEELKIYVVTGNPDKGKPDDGLIRHWHFHEYVAKARELWDLLARDHVRAQR